MTLTDLPSRWRDAAVLVIGDALLDGWLTGSPRRLCREAPVPVVSVERVTYACGGAANTAANIAALGGRAILAAAVGGDPDGGRLRRRLRASKVESRLVTVPGRSTVGKRRLVGDGQILVRFDQGDTGPLPPDRDAALVRHVGDELDRNELDAVVVCDYDAGTLGPRLRDLLAERRAEIPLLVVDAHDLRPWAAVAPSLVTPSFAEVERLVGAQRRTAAAARARWAADSAARLLALARAEVMAVTLDSDGTMVLQADAPPYRTYATPVPNGQTIGAGDAYVAAFTLALVAGTPVTEAAEVAQLAAAVATRTAGTAICDVDGLLAAGGAADSRVLEPPALLAQIAAHRQRGRRIVFTNGCFDVLHRGHVGYLNQAKNLGDVLVVAVNSDESVRRLKGPDRPVNPVEDRVTVLSALSCVDHVVVFDEDSPAALIAQVRPDVYVKGGDYRPELIPEASLVRRLGGRVTVLDYLPDRSTSSLIERIRSGTRRSEPGSGAGGHSVRPAADNRPVGIASSGAG
jgi:D-beta-D-heptose 7-phosphate kinase/D-beta-D-heptose 1-phosphate adenosyltransferase